MHIPNPGSKGPTLVLFPTSGNIDQKAFPKALPRLGLTTINYNQRIGQSQVQALGQSEDDAVRNSLGVRRELFESIGSLPRWRKGVRRKKTETPQKITGVAEKLAWSWEAYREFARTTSKVSGRSLGIRWEIAGGRS
ncbi:hypothetical protein B296_00015868 [Ensete ventricosum]|uniref:Uncharacterized protein n=1 Tax=Ensete ventricosum TaxID=4639 RepID=A0A426ZHY2_ENSVE|nr:hypothetical protein B296_00015868 [Ensete ventricosum]